MAFLAKVGTNQALLPADFSSVSNTADSLTVTCTFTADSMVDAVFYNGTDITNAVSGERKYWSSVKKVSFVIAGYCTGYLYYMRVEMCLMVWRHDIASLLHHWLSHGSLPYFYFYGPGEDWKCEISLSAENKRNCNCLLPQFLC